MKRIVRQHLLVFASPKKVAPLAHGDRSPHAAYGVLEEHQYNASVGIKEHDADVLILSSAIGSGHMRASAALVRGAK